MQSLIQCGDKFSILNNSNLLCVSGPFQSFSGIHFLAKRRGNHSLFRRELKCLLDGMKLTLPVHHYMHVKLLSSKQIHSLPRGGRVESILLCYSLNLGSERIENRRYLQRKFINCLKEIWKIPEYLAFLKAILFNYDN